VTILLTSLFIFDSLRNQYKKSIQSTNIHNMHTIRFVCFISAFLVTSFTHAQFFKASLIGNANFAQVDGDHIGGYNKLGLAAGIGIHHEIDDHRALGFEILYAQKGSKLVNDPKAVLQPIYIINSNYIDFPLVYTHILPTVDQLSFHTGLSVDIHLNGTIDDGFTATDAEFNPLEIAFLLGSTYLINDDFGFRVRHSYSLNKISSKLPPQSRRLFNRIGMYNRWFSVGVVYSLK
jgi:hypothetical protein